MANPTIIFNTKLNQAGALRDAKTLRDSLGKPIDIRLNTKSLAQPLGRITGDVAEFTKSLQAATARVTAFGATSGGIIAVSQAISEVAKSVLEVDKQLTELNTFLGQSQSKLQSVGDSLFKIAKGTASSFADTAEAAKEFARQGLSVEETLKRTNDALVLSRISGLGAADSVNALTTAINSFNKSGLDSAEIVNKLVKVDSNFAVSAADLAQALTRVGSAAQDSGVGFEELIAVVTTAQQTTGRGGAIIGNALKTIFTRLKRPEVLDQLQQLGVAVKDQNGALLSGTQILTNYISATKNLGQVEKARNDELLGGVYQINQLKAITNDLAKANGIYARSLSIANSATDDAVKKNEELNKSLAAIIQNTKTNFQQKAGSIGEPLIKPLVKKGADIANFLLDSFGVDKQSADKEGKNIGSSFAQQFLKGVGEAASGPGLVLIGALTFNIGKRLVSFVTDASKVLLNINSVAANTQAIEQAINNTLAQQPKITQAIAQGQITREQAAAQLLKLFTQQNQQLVLQKGLASSLAQSFAKSGFVASAEYGIYKNAKRKAGGYIPNFAAEKREAMSYGASPSVQPYMTEAVINGTPQVVTVNTGETVIPRYKGGVDTAIIPNYAKGNIPNFAGKQFTINSSAGFRNLIIGNKQKFLSIKYKTENGIVENFDAKNYVMQSGIAVRRDEYVGAAPPQPFKTWKEFREARNTISLRNPATGDRKTFRADRILEVNAGGNKFTPSFSLQKANELTSPFNSKTLRGMDIENLSKASNAISNTFDPQAARRSFRDSRKNLARGYFPPAARVGGGKTVLPTTPPNQQKAFESSIGQAVSSAVYLFLPSIIGGFANEKNQDAVEGTLKTAAAINLLTATISGFRRGGFAGAATSAAGASITSGALYYQGSQVKEGVRSQVFEKARDKAQDSFNKLTENIVDLTQTISDLDAQYSDPNAKPEALIKLAKKEQDLLKKISLNNPEAAIAYKSAGTPEEKINALAGSRDAAQREASLSKSILDFTELDQSKRDAKAIKSFFTDLAGQLNSENLDVKNLTGKNLSDFLQKGGIGKAGALFSDKTSGASLAGNFISFLKTQDQIKDLTKKTDERLAEIRKPILETRSSIERAQEIRRATREARGGYLENVTRFASNFGERSSIEAKSRLDKFNASEIERESFASKIRVESGNLTSFALKDIVNSLASKGPTQEFASKIGSIINDKKFKEDPKNIEILKRIFAEIKTSNSRIETSNKIAEVQKQFQIKNLSLQEKLVFGGGARTSVDAASKIDSFKNTQRGALQYQLGSMFGSRETQVAGLTNFATNLKEKYAGLFEGGAGPQIFKGIEDQLTNLRASDIMQSLSRDAMTARGIGQFGLASQLEGQLSPMNRGNIYGVARLQAQEQLKISPENLLTSTFQEASRERGGERAAKSQEDLRVRNEENKAKPEINSVTKAFIDEISRLQAPLMESLNKTFSKGVEIGNASLIINKLSGINFGSGSEKKGPQEGDVPAPTTEEVMANREEVRARSGFAKGFIPNFSSPLLDSVSREVSAGYSPSQVRIGQSSSLATPFNPSGFGVFNSTEGSLNNGMSLARNAGFNPQTKGMASGFIPNFAAKKKKAAPAAPVAKNVEQSVADFFEPPSQGADFQNKYQNEIVFAAEAVSLRLKLDSLTKEQKDLIRQNSPDVFAAAKSGETFLPSGSKSTAEIQKLIRESALESLQEENLLSDKQIKQAVKEIQLADDRVKEGYRQQELTKLAKTEVQQNQLLGRDTRILQLKKDLKEAKKAGDTTAVSALEKLINEEIEAKRTGKFAPKPLSGPAGFETPKISAYAADLIQRQAKSASEYTSGQLSTPEEILERVRVLSEGVAKPTQAINLASKAVDSALLNQPGKLNLSAQLTPSEISELDKLETIKEVASLNKAQEERLKLLKEKQAFYNDPKIKQALETFQATLPKAQAASKVPAAPLPPVGPPSSGTTGGGGLGGGAGGGMSGGLGGGTFRPFALLPAPGQTSDIGPFTKITADTEQRFVSERGGPLVSQTRSALSVEVQDQNAIDAELQRRNLLNQQARDARRNLRLLRSGNSTGEVYDPASRSSLYSKLESEMPSQTQSEQYKKYALNPEMEKLSLGTSAQKPGSKGYRFASARRGLIEYNSSQENQSTSRLIKSILLSESGLSRTAIKAMTGLWPEQVNKATPSALESLLRRRNIQISRTEFDAFGDKEGGLATRIDLSNSKLTPEEISIIQDSANNAKSTRKFFVDEKGGISEQITSTIAEAAKLKYPKTDTSLFGRAEMGGAGTIPIEGEGFGGKAKTQGLVSSISQALGFGGIGGVSGYVSRVGIDRKAVELLELERRLNSDPSISQKAKEQYIENFEKELGPFADKVKERSARLLENQNFRASQGSIRSKYTNALQPDGSVNLFGKGMNVFPSGKLLFEDISKNLSDLVGKGQITPEQAAQIQREIYLNDLKVSPTEYANILKNNKITPGDVADFYSQERQPTLKEQMAAGFAADDLATAKERVSKLGVRIDKEGNPISALKGSPGWRSYSQYRLEKIAEINKDKTLSPEEKARKIKEIRQITQAAEVLDKKAMAKNMGYEYNSLTREVDSQGSRKSQLAENAVIANQENTNLQETGGKPGKFQTGLGILGALFGLYGSYKSFSEEGGGQLTDKVSGSLFGLGAIASLPSQKMAQTAAKFGIGPEGLGKFAGGAFGLGGAISYGSEAIKEGLEGNVGKSIYATLEALVSGGAGAASLAGQSLLTQRLFGAGAGLSLMKQIYNAENAQLASGSTAAGRVFSLLTGQNFENFGELDAKQKRAVVESAIGDVVSTLFTATMGPVGAGVATFKVGYRAGNLIEEGLGIGEKLGDIMSGGTRGIFDAYKGVRFNERQNYTKYRFDAQGNKIGETFESDADYKAYLQEELKKGLSLSQYKDYNLRLSDIYAGGFIPNFAASSAAASELLNIKNRPDYAGYRDAVPMKSSIYDDKVINSAEIEVRAKDVYPRMFGPAGYAMSPKNPSETHAILNPAQQSALGYAGGFVPNFSMEDFGTVISEAMKNGMSSFAGGMVPQASNNVILNDNRSYMEDSNELMQGVLDVLFEKYPKEMAGLGPKITKFR